MVVESETVVLNYKGQTYTLKKNLTICEMLGLAGKRYKLTGGQYEALLKSEAPGDRDMAFLTDIVVELDSRIVNAPEDWEGAANESETKKLVDLWDMWMKESGFFRPPDSAGDGKAEGKTQSESKSKPKNQLDENMV